MLLGAVESFLCCTWPRQLHRDDYDDLRNIWLKSEIYEIRDVELSFRLLSRTKILKSLVVSCDEKNKLCLMMLRKMSQMFNDGTTVSSRYGPR